MTPAPMTSASTRSMGQALLSADDARHMHNYLRHVQVERFYISKRYRDGAVTIEPQRHVVAARKICGSVNCDLVVIKNADEMIKF